jgi:hypothetical protein
MRQFLTVLATAAGSAVLWAATLHELAKAPVTHTGTQPYHQVDR